MKTILLLLAIVALLFSSCKKSEKNNPTQVTTYCTFAGSFNSTYHCYINNIEKQVNIVYEVKKGDNLKVVDNGSDVYHQAEPTLYPIGGGSPIYGQPAYTEQGFTGGSIIITKDNKAVTVAQNTGCNCDTNLNYTVQ